MIPAIKESTRQDKQQSQVKTTGITYNQNAMFVYIHLKKLNEMIKIASDKN